MANYFEQFDEEPSEVATEVNYFAQFDEPEVTEEPKIAVEEPVAEPLAAEVAPVVEPTPDPAPAMALMGAPPIEQPTEQPPEQPLGIMGAQQPTDETLNVSRLGGALKKELIENVPERIGMISGGAAQEVGTPAIERLASSAEEYKDASESSPILDKISAAIDLAPKLLSSKFENEAGPTLARVKKGIYDWGKDLFKTSQEEAQRNRPEGLNPLETAIVDVARGIEDMGPALAVGAITRNPTLPVSIITGQVYGQTYGESRDMGLDPTQATNRSKFMALAEGLPEMIPFSAILKKGSPIIRKYFDGMVGEGAQEMITEVLQNAYDDVNLEGMSLKDALTNIDWNKVGYAGLIGAGVGTGMAGSMHIVDAAETKYRKSKGLDADIVEPVATVEPVKADQTGSPPELFSPTHTLAGGQDVQVVTEAGQVVPDSYIDSEGNVYNDPGATANPDFTGDLSLDVNAVAGAVKADIEAKRSGIIGVEMPAATEAGGVIDELESGMAQPPRPDTLQDTMDRITDLGDMSKPVGVDAAVEAAKKPAFETADREAAKPVKSKKLKPMAERKAEVDAVKAEIDQITEAGKAREKEFLDKDPHTPIDGFEPLTFQTEEEKTRLHELKQQMPSSGQEAADAKERIGKRLEARKAAGKEVTAAANEAATSPENNLPEPTEAQKESGNYKKGHTNIQGLDIAIENPAGSKRRPEWPTLKQHYGYIKRTVGADSEAGAAPHQVEQIDAFVNPDKDVSTDNPIFIIDQAKEDGTGFDEHKVMMGFASKEEASEAYLANYTKGWKGLKAVTQATPEEFKTWLNKGNTKADYATGKIEAVVPRETEIKAKGKESKVTTSKGTETKTKFAVVDADTLIASNDDAGNKNPLYPKELQPRDRTRGASQLQIKKIANNLNPALLEDSIKASDGAPIVGPDGVVESGNARTLGIRGAYAAKKADAYRQHLIKNAASYGLTEADISSIETPVLVRVRQGEMETAGRAEFAREANQPDIAPMSPVEQAQSDADRITDEDMQLYAPSDKGNILAASNQKFLQNFAKKLGSLEVGGLSTTDGRWTKQMGDRVQAAIFEKAYGDERLLNLVAEEADPDVKNVLNALNQAAPAFARARGVKKDLGKLDIVSDIVEAIDVIRKAKADGTSVQQAVSQTGLFGNTDPVVNKLAEFIEANTRSSKRMGIGFSEMAKFLEAELLSESQEALFEKGEITKEDILAAADKRIKEVYGNEKGIQDLFGQVEPRIDERADKPSDSSRKQGEGDRAKAEVTEPKITEYPIADRGEWYGDADYKARGGKIIEMTPDEYLNQVRPLEIEEIARENINDLKEHILSGRTLDPLVIYEDGKEDGRHRANAAKELGIKKVPVIVFGEKTLPLPDAAARAEPKQDPYRAMNGKEISYEIEVEDTGETYTVTVDAGVVMKELDARAEALNELRGCI